MKHIFNMETVYLEILKARFEKRKSTNSRYSLRAFARDLGLNPGVLSAILNQKRGIPFQRVRDLSEKLHLSDQESKEFEHSIYERKKKLRRMKPELRLAQEPATAEATAGESEENNSEYRAV